MSGGFIAEFVGPCVGDDDGVFFIPGCFGLIFGGVGGFGLTIVPDDVTVPPAGPKLFGDIFGEITAPPESGYFGETVLGGYFGDVVGARIPIPEPGPYPLMGLPDMPNDGRFGDVSSDFMSSSWRSCTSMTTRDYCNSRGNTVLRVS